MADTKVSALTAVAAATAAQEIPVNDAGTSKKLTVDQMREYYAEYIAGNSGNANPNGPPSWTLQVLSTNAAAATGTTMGVILTTASLSTTGAYWFRYDLIGQAAATGNSFRFAVNFTGTNSRMVYRVIFPSAGVTAATGAVDQDVNATTGAVVAHHSARANNTILGPQASVDTSNADIHFIIEGMLKATGTGDLQLLHSSGTTGNTQIMLGSMLRLLRMI